MLPAVNLKPPFNITRASHLVLRVADLPKSRDFYVDIVGLVVTEESASVCYLRGLAETCHHSLVLVQSNEVPTCERMGFRVFLEEDLDIAHDHFKRLGLPAHWVEVPHQGRTLHVEDPIGTKLELCAVMDQRERLYLQHERFRGAHAQTLDHFSIFAPDTYALCQFYSELGFRNSEYLAHDEKLLGAFLYRKGTCLDLAIVEDTGPRLHHFAYMTTSAEMIFTAADLAGNLGYATAVERGPGRHGPGGMLFVYLRDPDGHRVEVFNNHYQAIDVDTIPVRWDAAALSTNARWGLPAEARWYAEASAFEGASLIEPEVKPHPETLESYVLKRLALET